MSEKSLLIISSIIFVGLIILLIRINTHQKKSLSHKSKTITFKELKNQDARRILTSFLKDKILFKYNTDQLFLNPLTLGRSSAGLYKFSLDNSNYVLRMFSPLDNNKYRKQEAYISRIAGEHGVAPKVYYVDSKLKGMIIEFLAGHTLVRKDLNDPKSIISFAKFLRKVHALPVKEHNAQSPFQMGAEWLKKARNKKAAFPSEFEKLHNIIAKIKIVLSHVTNNQVVIHNDLIPLNIMVNKSSFKLIDWPASGNGDPLWDLSMFTDFNNLSTTESNVLLKEYFGRNAQQEELDRFTIMRPVSAFIRTIGGFAFAKKSYSTKFYDNQLREGNLPSFKKLINDLSLGKLQMPLWKVALIFFSEAKRLINDPNFTEALNRLSKKKSFLEQP